MSAVEHGARVPEHDEIELLIEIRDRSGGGLVNEVPAWDNSIVKDRWVQISPYEVRGREFPIRPDGEPDNQDGIESSD